MTSPRIAIQPFSDDELEEAVRNGGGEVTDPRDADGLVWTNPMDPQGLKETLTESPARWVQLPFAGIESFLEAEVIDSERTWTCTKGAYGRATAEHALALILAGARLIHVHARRRRWQEPGLGLPEFDLKDRLVVIVGTGGIGRELRRMLAPLRARVIGVNRSGRPLEGAEKTVTSDRLGDVVGGADFLVLAAAVTRETRGLIDAPMLAKMKEGSWLINVARGVLVDTDALVESLNAGHLAGAALDVTEPEPLPEDHALWAMENVIITPHIANTWDMALPELRAVVARNVERFRKGDELEGLVDVRLGY